MSSSHSQQTKTPIWLAAVVTSLVTLFLLSSVLQIRINARNKQQCRSLTLILLCLLLELAFGINCMIATIHSTASFTSSQILLILVLCSTSYIAYSLISNVPQKVKHGTCIDKTWKWITVLQIAWFIVCVVIRTALWQQTYFVGLYAYMIVGCSILIYITYQIRCNLQFLIRSCRQSCAAVQPSASSFQADAKPELDNPYEAVAHAIAIAKKQAPAVAVVDSKQHQQDAYVSTTVNQIHGITGTQWAILSHQSKNPFTRLWRLKHALRELNRTLCMVGILLMVSCLALAWKTSFLFLSFDDATIATSDTSPFSDVGHYVLHYLMLFLLYAVVMKKYPTASNILRICKRGIHSSNDVQSPPNNQWDDNLQSPAQHGNSLYVESPPESHPPMAIARNHDRIAQQNIHHKHSSNKLYDEHFLEELDVARHAELYEYVVRSQCKAVPVHHGADASHTLAVLTGVPPPPECLEAGNSMPEYSQLSKTRLSRTHLEANLSAIDLDGHIIGKRGSNTVHRIKADEIERRKQEFDEEKVPRLVMMEQASAHNTPTGATTAAVSRQASVTVLTVMSNPARDTPSADTADSLDRLIEHIVDDMREPVRVVVLELDRVLCTQNGQLLRNKTANFIESLQLFKQQLYFGGHERLIMLQQWLQRGMAEKVKFYVISDEQSRMLVSLLFSVDLLKFFASINPNNERKLLSHVIGYDHRIYREQNGKRHLILLNLLQLLQQPHSSLLYIGGDRDTIEHIQHIDVCKTYHVETGGLIQGTLQQIDEKFFATK